mmetsp:Transcript_13616/g.33492  ORF Transcript_13616/g.33492 Transcript_13616/m.33492 type:complete len:241 (+) Transcript_13616:494-1216(+)
MSCSCQNFPMSESCESEDVATTSCSRVFSLHARAAVTHPRHAAVYLVSNLEVYWHDLQPHPVPHGLRRPLHIVAGDHRVVRADLARDCVQTVHERHAYRDVQVQFYLVPTSREEHALLRALADAGYVSHLEHPEEGTRADEVAEKLPGAVQNAHVNLVGTVPEREQLLRECEADAVVARLPDGALLEEGVKRLQGKCKGLLDHPRLLVVLLAHLQKLIQVLVVVFLLLLCSVGRLSTVIA